MKIMTLAMASILVLAAVLLALPWSGIRVSVSNVTPEFIVRVAVSIDGRLMATFDVPKMEVVTVGEWTVWSGSHMVEINYDFPLYPPMDNLEDPPEWEQDVKVSLFSVKDVYVGLWQGREA